MNQLRWPDRVQITLPAYLFDTLEQLRILSDQWMDTYNSKHPHRSMKGLTPNQKGILLEEEAMKEKELTVENHTLV
ncbi:integrase core domain-containing protein [Dyadobacter sp. LHD-138]|uniref:integrase core domain-containing protein n=1 Tax=Dyadobacter sp. LHD-138 TaxID=3071413 RepID=UPI0027E0AEB7|nr:integrase core domain-containing protein [Dyadobacter sp. LHD-138]MDQ6480605.1 integrase core domain-containing protein [Dyadobacter sp. LHD-138]